MNRKSILFGVLVILLTTVGFTACVKVASDPNGSTSVIINGDHLDLTFSTTNLYGQYAPRYVMAIWVENSNGDFITSLAVYARARKQYLVKWYGASKGITADAITGATIYGAKSFDVLWDLKDYHGTRVPDGTYKVYLEETSNDASGPSTSISVNIGSSSYTTFPSGSNNFKNLSVNVVVSDSASVSALVNDPTTGP